MRVLLVPNTGNEAAMAATAELATWLSAAGFSPILPWNDVRGTGLESFGVPGSEIGEPLLAVALGGDGTILKAVHVLGEASTPLLGVKFGRLGFLAGATADSMRDAVEAALAGEARIERRATLQAEVTMDGRVVGVHRALNEVVVARSGAARVVALDVALDGRRIAQLRADGVIVATATGSTAYALSAGGPVVAPAFGGMVIVPIAPHTLSARPLITDPGDTVEITFPDSTRAEACVVIDGEATPCRQSVQRVKVSRGAHDVSLVKLEGRDFYDTVAEEFFGG